MLVEYIESAPSGDILNKESGSLPGFQLGFSKTVNELASFGASVAVHSGDIDYEGQTQSGSPLTTTTSTRYWNAGLWAGLGATLGVFEVEFGPELYFRNWARDIEPTASTLGLKTDYTWFMPGLFMGADYSINNAQGFSLETSIFSSRRIKARADLREISLGEVVLEPASKPGFRSAFAWKAHLDSGTWLAVELFYEKLQFGRSPSVRVLESGRVFRINEPASTSERKGVGITFFF